MSKNLIPVLTFRGSLKFVSMFALAVLALAPLSAQTTTGTITGTVVDPSNNVIPAAMVSLTNESTGDVRRAETTATGDFSFPSLLPATYTVQVEMKGFQTYRSSGNVLTPNGRLALGELRLTVGAVTETIEVAGQAAQVATQSGENSALITRDQFSMIPTKGRDLTNMLRLLPGIQMTGDQEAFGGATGFGATIGAVRIGDLYFFPPDRGSHQPLHRLPRPGDHDWLRFDHHDGNSGRDHWLTTFTVAAPNLVSIAVTPANFSILPGTSLQYTPTGTYSDATTENLTNTVTWSSSLPGVATITASGLASSVALGTTTISATLGAVSGGQVSRRVLRSEKV